VTHPESPTAPATALHPRLAALAAVLDEARRELLDAAHEIPPAARTARPTPDRWSAAEVLEHLAKVEDQSGRLFSVGARGLRESGATHEQDNEASAIIEGFSRFRVDTRLRAVEAPEMVAPSADANFDAALIALAATRARLLASMHKASGLALSEASAPHPRLGPLTLYEWLLMIARHEQRHAGQLREIRATFAEEYDV